MIKFAMDGITSFSNKPLKLASYIGVSISLVSFMYLLYAVFIKIFTNDAISGWTSIIACSTLFNGIILIILGVIGEYIGRIYDEVKGRPLYVVSDTVGLEEYVR